MRNLVDADAEVIHGLAVAELQRVELALERVRLRLLHTSTLTYMVLIASHARDRLRRYSFCDDLKCHTVLDVVVGGQCSTRSREAAAAAADLLCDPMDHKAAAVAAGKADPHVYVHTWVIRAVRSWIVDPAWLWFGGHSLGGFSPAGIDR